MTISELEARLSELRGEVGDIEVRAAMIFDGVLSAQEPSRWQVVTDHNEDKMLLIGRDLRLS